jgi:hypothetical protein
MSIVGRRAGLLGVEDIAGGSVLVQGVVCLIAGWGEVSVSAFSAKDAAPMDGSAAERDDKAMLL